MSTYETALDQLRAEWRSTPDRRGEIESQAADLIAERDDAPLIAVHEVGHALVALQLGNRVLCLSRMHGHGHIRTLDIYGRAPGRWDTCITAAGGYVLSELAGVEDPDRGCKQDKQLCEYLDEPWSECVQTARRMVADYEPWSTWAAQRLVTALMDHIVLGEAEILAAIDEAPRQAGAA